MDYIVDIALVIIGIGLLIGIFKMLKNAVTQWKEKKVTVDAEVFRLKKERRNAKNSGVPEVDATSNFSHTQLFASFKLNNGKLVTFVINKKNFLTLSEHQKGKLTYKGYRFLQFIEHDVEIKTHENTEKQ